MSTGSPGGIVNRPASAPRVFPTSGFQSLDSVKKLEEENWEWYSAETFYPARIGEVLQSRYQILGKLGYGAHSIVWLARDLCAHRYSTLKICEQDSTSADREFAAYSHLKTVNTTKPGAQYIRQMHDAFKIQGRAGEHLCLVHEPLAMNMEVFRWLLPKKQLPEVLLKALIEHLLRALDYLHCDAHMVHTDLQARNIHLGLDDDDSILTDFEKDEFEEPSPRKSDGGRVIYKSRGLGLPKNPGRPVLCDFGEARFGNESYTDLIQPSVYRAPEVILEIPWSYSADIWNLALLIWDLFENDQLFSASNEAGEQSAEAHLAQMVAILGPPPLEFLQRSEVSSKYFNPDGSWKASSPIPDISLEASEKRLEGENKAQFLAFIRKMVHWTPEKRYTAEQLLEDPWLNNT